MFELTKLNFGFAILSPEYNYGALKCTVRSITNFYPNASIVCATARSTGSKELKEMKEICPTFRGKNTITSLMNTALKKGNKEWNIIIMEGTPVRVGFVEKISRFYDSEKDIFFSISMDYNIKGYPTKIRDNFVDCSLNGITMHQNAYKEVGDFGDESLEMSKNLWSVEAHNKGYRFVGILGSKLI
jgi:hypothetical protein